MPSMSWTISTALHISAIVAAGFYGVKGAENCVVAWGIFVFAASFFTVHEDCMRSIAKAHRDRGTPMTPLKLDATFDLITAGLFAWLGWFWLLSAYIWTVFVGLHVREQVKKINERHKCQEQSSGKGHQE